MLSARDLTHQMSRLLADLSEDTLRLQVLISDNLESTQKSGPSQALITGLQDLDRITQILQDLSGLCERAAITNLADRDLGRLLNDLKLQEVSLRLQGLNHKDSSPDMEMF